MDKWEYKVIDINYMTEKKIESVCNKLGAEGWELVCACGDYPETILFKRKI